MCKIPEAIWEYSFVFVQMEENHLKQMSCIGEWENVGQYCVY